MAKKKQKMVEDQKKEIHEAKSQRLFYLNKITKLIASMSIEQFEALSEFDLRAKKIRLQELFDKFEEKCMALQCIDAEAGTGTEDDEIDALCQAIKSKIAARLKQSLAMQQGNAPQVPAEIKNPGQCVPVVPNTWGDFTGSLYEWHKFSKRFKSDVHENAKLEKAEKLELLQNACKANAANIILNAEDNYELAWSRLNDMYGESYTQTHYCVRRLLDVPQIDKPSSEAIQRLMNDANRCMEIMKDTMDQTKYDTFVTVMLTGKLDDETSRAWERQRAMLADSWANAAAGSNTEKRVKSKHMPSFDDFSTFLKGEIELYAKSEMQRNLHTASLPMPGNAPVTRKVDQDNSHKISVVRSRQAWSEEKRRAPSHLQCTLCEGIHAKYNCDVFKNMEYVDKWRNVEAEQLCVRCLKKKHYGKCDNKLSNEKCPACYMQDSKIAYHNSKLCPIRNNLPTSAAPEDEWSN